MDAIEEMTQAVRAMFIGLIALAGSGSAVLVIQSLVPGLS